MMKLVLYMYTYSTGELLKAPQVLPYTYGEFLLRKRHGPELRYLNALEDTAYEEVDQIIKENFSAGVHDLTDLLQIAFGPAACDADKDGQPFEMNLWPYSDKHGCDAPSAWQITDPPEFVEIEIPSVEHEFWDSLSVEQRNNRVIGCLKSFGIERTV